LAKPAENPYLQAMNEPPPVVNVPQVPPPTVSPLASSPTPTMVAPAPATPPPPQSKIPEFAKPATDSKLFKPLKRF
jgi:hypothetical protein